MESVNVKKPMGNFKSAAASRRSSKKRKGFMKKKEGNVDFSVADDVDEVEDLQPVVVAGDVSEKSDNIDVNMFLLMFLLVFLLLINIKNIES